ncbi:hypothetical protein CAEBREN_30312 [Caenorhabditis brenneri]|uniref:Uncharacterized protein n=1 Tax=Caenorhabditis brenneri TaxID=135651 RepID=G0PD13_CAEBE|nr:hypothetical protein CAEBREN_30312 [Caenorhabditis brenneri]
MLDQKLTRTAIKGWTELYGDSLQWGGLTLITLLGQHRRFEVLDFCYHLHRVNKADGKDEVINGIRLSKMVERIRRFQLLNNQIFIILTNQLNENNDDDHERVREFAPPVHPNYANHARRQ